MKKLSVLALEPFYGGSHKSCLDSWIAHSHHEFTVLGLPDKFWRWRSRHSAWTFSQQVTELNRKGMTWDIIFCTELLNLAEFKGLAPDVVKLLPAVTYFHENQLTYPVHDEKRRDQTRILANFSTALAATEVWFNSAHNRDSFINGLPAFFERMPDIPPVDMIPPIAQKSRVMHLGVAQECFHACSRKQNRPLHLLWAARWEPDKNPQDFFKALDCLKKKSISFQISVIGEPHRTLNSFFEKARELYAENILNWGYLPSRADYIKVLKDADVIISTSNHEFFGLSVMEAVTAGAFPVLPDRLSYPELFVDSKGNKIDDFFYNGTAESLAEKLIMLAELRSNETPLWSSTGITNNLFQKKYNWDKRAEAFDLHLNQVYTKANN